MNYPNFSHDELACRCCGRRNPDQEAERQLMERVQQLRTELGFSLPVTSAYRCPDHPEERDKAQPGWHSRAAIDLGVAYGKAYKVLGLAIKLKFTGIGINQKGPVNKRFIHLDLRPTPRVWSY